MIEALIRNANRYYFLPIVAMAFCIASDAEAQAPANQSHASINDISTDQFERSKPLATFDNPWAVKILPDGRFLVTQATAHGAISIVSRDGKITSISGLPENQGIFDILLPEDFEKSRSVYFSYTALAPRARRVGRGAELPEKRPRRLTVARAVLSEGSGTARLINITKIFEQTPAITAAGDGEYGARMIFSPDGRYLFISSGDRHEMDGDFLGQIDNNIGKIIRIFSDGTIPKDNPFWGQHSRGEVWTLGHRNPYGLAFAPDGTLWSSEMGPKGGDELNVILPSRDYGWPTVSNGDHYHGEDIPDHSTSDIFEAPKLSWTPVIAPAGMIFYQGTKFPGWQGDIILTGLMSLGLVRVQVRGTSATEVQRVNLSARIRDIVEDHDGSLWIITDGLGGELREITPDF